MDRMACVDVFALPLQVMLRRYPEWGGQPAAVVDEDRPQGRILWVNEAARHFGVLPGLRYANALSLASGLRASVVPFAAIGSTVAEISRVLRDFTPNVEPSTEEPGIFWLDATGLEGLYPSLGAWGEAIVMALGELGLQGSIAIAWSRFGSYALARANPGVIDLETPEGEREAVAGVQLARLSLSPGVRDRLDRLGVKTVGAFIELPAAGLLKRYGAEAYRVWRLAQNDLFAPLAPSRERPPAASHAVLDFIERDAHRLLFTVEGLLGEVVTLLRQRESMAAELRLTLTFDGGAGPPRSIPHLFRPAAPTLDEPLLLDLVRLRLETIDLRAGVIEVRLGAREVAASPDQIRLFSDVPRRDQAAAERALARIRAELGEGAVGRFQLREGHLPEARFAHRPLERLEPPSARRPRHHILVRRLRQRPVILPARPREFRNDGWQPRDPQQGPIMNVTGPYIISGGWWHHEIRREYAFAQTLRGDLLWVFYDKRRRRWFEQGRVE